MKICTLFLIFFLVLPSLKAEEGGYDSTKLQTAELNYQKTGDDSLYIPAGEEDTIKKTADKDSGFHFNITLIYNKFKISNKMADMGGANAEIFVTKNLSLNYSIALGVSDNKTYFHCHGGLAGGVYLLANDIFGEDKQTNSGEFTTAMGVLTMFIPEGINYYIPFKFSDNINASLVPYIYPISFDYIGDDRYSVSTSIGMKLQLPLSERLFVMPQAGISYLYKMDNIGYNIGAGLGIKF